MARWDPLHQYWTTNSVLGVDINMGRWGGVDKMADQWMSTRDLMKVCVCVCVCVCVYV